ncbi:hypothetical protein EXVG_00109 [Emiliania huxleyi virus 202]|nr:hypothetical protein EXVG_00109 [Emiliania huxleyi virus 202]AHA54438.1 putative membrane protein [Emiliania huxleyi virus 18]AHA55479.1 putative membrane protein [Emiliania huxleyi virus 156]
MISQLIIIGVAIILIITGILQNTHASIGFSIATSAMLIAYAASTFFSHLETSSHKPVPIGKLVYPAITSSDVTDSSGRQSRESWVDEFLASTNLPDTEPGEHTPRGRRLSKSKRDKYIRAIKRTANKQRRALTRSAQVKSMAERAGTTPKKIVNSLTKGGGVSRRGLGLFALGVMSRGTDAPNMPGSFVRPGVTNAPGIHHLAEETPGYTSRIGNIGSYAWNTFLDASDSIAPATNLVEVDQL